MALCLRQASVRLNSVILEQFSRAKKRRTSMLQGQAASGASDERGASTRLATPLIARLITTAKSTLSVYYSSRVKKPGWVHKSTHYKVIYHFLLANKLDVRQFIISRNRLIIGAQN